MISTLESERLRFERPRPEHADTLERLIFSDAKVMQFGGSGPANVRDWIADAERTHAEHGFGPWILVNRNSGEILGFCGLFHVDINGKNEVVIGYRLAQEAQRQGYATEATRRVLRDARELGTERVVALVDPANMASRRVVEKVGFTHESNVMLPGYTQPDELYAIRP